MTMSIAGETLADGAHAVAVSARVNQVCRILAVPTLVFRGSDSAAGGVAIAVQSPGSLRCTKGSTFTVVSDSPAWESMTDATNSRARLAHASGAGCSDTYECLRQTPTQVATGTGLGLGAGNNIAFGISGPAAFADDANEADSTVILTVNP